jgi:hypothetical protein
MRRLRPRRHGYALMLVIVFVVLFSAILGVAWRRVASVLRVEHASEVRRQGDQGTVVVLAEAMKLLEMCLRLNTGNVATLPDSSPPNEFSETLGTAPNQKFYVVTFTPYDGDTTGRKWTVSVKNVASEDIGSRASISYLLDHPN